MVVQGTLPWSLARPFPQRPELKTQQGLQPEAVHIEIHLDKADPGAKAKNEETKYAETLVGKILKAEASFVAPTTGIHRLGRDPMLHLLTFMGPRFTESLGLVCKRWLYLSRWVFTHVSSSLKIS